LLSRGIAVQPHAPKTRIRQHFQADLGSPVLAAKIFRFAPDANQLLFRRVPRHQEGVSRSSRNVERDATDAVGPMTKVPIVYGKVVWF
jgi:hypothetical protein